MPKRPVDLQPPPRPAPARNDSKAIVEAILQAARELPTDSSVNVIAQRAGVGVASLYRYFPGKEAIYGELARQIHGRIFSVASAKMEAAETLEEAIAGCVDIALEQFYEEQHIVDHVHANLPHTWHGEEAAQMAEQTIAFVTEQLGRFLTATPTQSRTRARMMLVMLRGVARTNALLSRDGTEQAEERALLEAALNACARQGLQPRRVPE